MAATDTFRVERSIMIAAAPQTLYPFIDDFHQWTLWSPFEKLDADLGRTYSGAGKGVGAVYEWTGKKAGAGRMEVVASSPAQVVIDLQFNRPMKAHNTATFTLEPDAGGTRVTWVMTGTQNLMMKLMSAVFSMDKIVGKDFETGLANLKTIGEAKAAA